MYMRDTYRRCSGIEGSGSIGETGADGRVVVAQDAQGNWEKRNDHYEVRLKLQ